MTGSGLEFRCRELTRNLREALGPDGCSALLTRALAQCEPQHPVLKHMRGPDEREIRLEGVSAAIAQHGLAVVEAAVEAVETALVDILERLIGEDMARRLVEIQGRDSSDAREDA